MGGVAFPITEAAKQGINDLKRGSYNYLQFNISKWIYSRNKKIAQIQKLLFRFCCEDVCMMISMKLGIA